MMASLGSHVLVQYPDMATLFLVLKKLVPKYMVKIVIKYITMNPLGKCDFYLVLCTKDLFLVMLNGRGIEEKKLSNLLTAEDLWRIARNVDNQYT